MKINTLGKDGKMIELVISDELIADTTKQLQEHYKKPISKITKKEMVDYMWLLSKNNNKK
jgi:hypothetical protein